MSVVELEFQSRRLTLTFTVHILHCEAMPWALPWLLLSGSLIELMVSPPHWSPNSGVIFPKAPSISLTSTVCLTHGLRPSHGPDSVDRRGNRAVMIPAWVKLISAALKLGTRQSKYLSHSGAERAGDTRLGSLLQPCLPLCGKIWREVNWHSERTGSERWSWQSVQDSVSGCSWDSCTLLSLHSC